VCSRNSLIRRGRGEGMGGGEREREKEAVKQENLRVRGWERGGSTGEKQRQASEKTNEDFRERGRGTRREEHRSRGEELKPRHRDCIRDGVGRHRERARVADVCRVPSCHLQVFGPGLPVFKPLVGWRSQKANVSQVLGDSSVIGRERTSTPMPVLTAWCPGPALSWASLFCPSCHRGHGVGQGLLQGHQNPAGKWHNS
jgi:hypothetical protein